MAPMAGLCGSMAGVGVDLLLAEVVSLPRTSDGSLMDVGCVEGGSTWRKLQQLRAACCLHPQ